MPDRDVLRLDEVRAADTAVVGGKAAALGELIAQGFPVPPGFVVSAAAYAAVLAGLPVEDDLRALETGPETVRAAAARRIQRALVEAEVTDGLAREVEQAHATLAAGKGDLACVVRSSATAEDGSQASFAGQHGTYYHVGAARLVEMVGHCWASLWSAEAVAYRATRGIAHASVRMAVVVQEMVRSEVSGVAFTADPVSGDRGQILIESSWGMGAALVDGRVNPDHYRLARDGLRLRERRIADKRLMVPARLPPGAAERLAPVPPHLRRAETLRADQVQTVAGWAVKCEECFGSPQDVEWAIADGRFHLLQSRPVTALGGAAPFAAGVTGKYVLFKSVAENLTDPLTPLTLDLLTGHGSPIQGSMKVIGGRLYSNLDHFRRVIPFALTDDELARILYLGPAPASMRLSLLKLPVTLALLLFLYFAVGVFLARTRGLPDDFMEGFRGFCRRADEDPSVDAPEAQRRLLLAPRLFAPAGHMPILVNLSSLRFAPWLSLVRAMLRRWAPAAAPDAAPLLCAGSPGVLSAEMGREIALLAAEARRSPAVAGLISSQPPEAVLARLREDPGAAAFRARLDAFLSVHGHRGLREFELMSPRWDEDPAPVIAMVRNMLSPEAPGPAPAPARDRAEREVSAALNRRLLERPFPLRALLLRFAAARARSYFKLRENSRFYHLMGFAVVRRKVRAVEAELLARGALKCRDDIFFLRWGEVAALRAGRLAWVDVEDRLRARRLEHIRLSKVSPPRTVGIDTPDAAAAGVAPADGRLVGRPASPGRYEGIARVILDPAVDAVLRPGEVLVAPYTDPAWTPLFLTAGAAVVEVGSYLSHAGTVAREYGMPCVVDVPDCMRLIETGTRVEVDGDRGTVRIVAARAGAA